VAVTPYPTLPSAETDHVSLITSSDMNAVINAFKNGPQGHVSAPATLTASSATTTTAEIDSGLTITTPIIPTGRWLKITADFYAASSVNTDVVDVYVQRDGTKIQHAVVAAANDNRACIVTWDNPTNAAHTYKVSFKRNAGTGNVFIYGSTPASALEPWLSVEDDGAA
jgi:hypothetical protein